MGQDVLSGNEGGLLSLRRQVLEHLDGGPELRPLGGVGIFHCRSPQAIRSVPIHHSTLILVLSGQKELQVGLRRYQAQAGEVLLVPARSSVYVANIPSCSSHTYLSLAMGFAPQTLKQFRRDYGAQSQTWALGPQWWGRATQALLGAMEQWVQWCRRYATQPEMVRHRQVELLLLLAQAGLAGNLLVHSGSDWSQRVVQLLSLDLARDWRIDEVCARLGTSETVLRRRLRDEDSGFRALLEETRLVAGLSLLQETFWPIVQVAAAVGYRSQSRFSERFKERFGLTPSQLRRTREAP